MDRWGVRYDRDCGFCRWGTGKRLAWERRGCRLASWHVLGPDGRVRSAGRAVAPLLRLLPAGAPLAALADAFPRTTDRLYVLTARHRGRLGALLGARRCAVEPSGKRDERSTPGS